MPGYLKRRRGRRTKGEAIHQEVHPVSAFFLSRIRSVYLLSNNRVISDQSLAYIRRRLFCRAPSPPLCPPTVGKDGSTTVSRSL
ncbi:hypothetical protein CEXT_623661 [Caerostris extrusa]|uniref:Uncharacterized protein n=1 Tax=Caerostris extrusa TaxID=172846 RepID=A0AAV4PJ13_CAEEX|nr:hypothetical protein CEXT_623661 [Caerostris extrusa]